MDKKIIAVSATQGTGKTYLAYSLCIFLKKQGKNVIVLDELAREAPFEINKNASDKTQIWLSCKQVVRELELMERYEYIITDRSVLDSYCYGAALQELLGNGKDWIYNELLGYLSKHIKRYYKHLYVLDPIAFNYNIEDGVRDTDKNFRDLVHSKLIETYTKAEIDYKLIRADVEVYSDFAGLKNG